MLINVVMATQSHPLCATHSCLWQSKHCLFIVGYTILYFANSFVPSSEPINEYYIITIILLLHPQYKFTFLRLLGNYVVIMM